MPSAFSTPWFHLLPTVALFLLTVVPVPPVAAQQTLENPTPGSFQSGKGGAAGGL